MSKFILQVIMGLILLSSATVYAGADDVMGVWLNQEKDAKIEIFKCNEKYCGKIVWLKVPLYPADSSEGIPGTPKLDHNNPDSKLSKIPNLGLIIVHDFVHSGKAKWVDGKVYDPKNGKTYSGKLTLVSPSQLNLRGFIGISLFGRTAVWTREQKGDCP